MDPQTASQIYVKLIPENWLRKLLLGDMLFFIISLPKWHFWVLQRGPPILNFIFERSIAEPCMEITCLFHKVRSWPHVHRRVRIWERKAEPRIQSEQIFSKGSRFRLLVLSAACKCRSPRRTVRGIRKATDPMSEYKNLCPNGSGLGRRT